MVFNPINLILNLFVEWVDHAPCNISQRVVPLSSLERNSPFALDVDVLVRVDLQTRTSQHLFVTFNTEAGKGVEPILLQERAQALGPAGGMTHLRWIHQVSIKYMLI